MIILYRQVSSSQWKKYMEGAVVGAGVGMGLSRHKTDLEVSRKPHNKHPPHNGLQRKTDKKRITGIIISQIV